MAIHIHERDWRQPSCAKRGEDAEKMEREREREMEKTSFLLRWPTTVVRAEAVSQAIILWSAEEQIDGGDTGPIEDLSVGLTKDEREGSEIWYLIPLAW